MGQVPNLDDGWTKIAQCLDDDAVNWLVFRRRQEHTPDWSTYKVVADGRAANKANYWMVRNDKTGQIGFIRDFASMKENRPKLHSKIERVFYAL